MWDRFMRLFLVAFTLRKKAAHAAAFLRRLGPHPLVVRVLVDAFPRGAVRVAGDAVEHLCVLRKLGRKVRRLPAEPVERTSRLVRDPRNRLQTLEQPPEGLVRQAPFRRAARRHGAAFKLAAGEQVVIWNLAALVRGFRLGQVAGGQHLVHYLATAQGNARSARNAAACICEIYLHLTFG